MPISLVAAVARNGTIGLKGLLPWRLPADLARFKHLTLGHPVLMGRRTHESIGRPLPGRRNIVLTRDPAFAAPGCEVVHSVEVVAALAGEAELFIIGGASLYSAFLPLADRLYLTHIDADIPGDTFFPAVDPGQWRLVEESPGIVDAANTVPHRFAVYERIRP
jgi:dihydrofolate reductase